MKRVESLFISAWMHQKRSVFWKKHPMAVVLTASKNAQDAHVAHSVLSGVGSEVRPPTCPPPRCRADRVAIPAPAVGTPAAPPPPPRVSHSNRTFVLGAARQQKDRPCKSGSSSVSRLDKIQIHWFSWLKKPSITLIFGECFRAQ